MNVHKWYLKTKGALLILVLLLVSLTACGNHPHFNPIQHEGTLWHVAYYQGSLWLVYFWSTNPMMAEQAPRNNVFWISDLRAFSVENLPGIFTSLMENNGKTGSVENIELVPLGVLFTVDYGDLSAIGTWYADVIAQVFHGTPPRQISQIYQSDARLAINPETVRRIGYGLPDSLLKAADEVFQVIPGV